MSRRPSVHLRLFRSATSDAKDPRYAGTLLVPGVPPVAYNVQAWLEDYQATDGTGTRKCLCGFISGRQEVKGGKLPDQPPDEPATGNLLEPLEELPFDDPLSEKPF